MGSVINLCCWIPTGIAAIVIATQYDDSSACNDGTDYIVDLQPFLYVVGGVQLGSLMCTMCCALFGGPSSNRSRYDGGGMMDELASSLTSLLTLPLLFVWSIIGVYMFDAQMSDSCQEEPIAQMIRAWSTLTIVLFAVFAMLLGVLLCNVCSCRAGCCACCFEDDFKRKYASYDNMNALKRTETRYKSMLRKQRSIYKSATVRAYQPAKDSDHDDDEQGKSGVDAQAKKLQTANNERGSGQFVCDLCDKAYERQSGLSVHLQTVGHKKKAEAVGADEHVSDHEDEEAPETAYLRTAK